MVNLRSQLHTNGLHLELVEFVCSLVDLCEFEDKLAPPTVTAHLDAVELSWRHGVNRLVIRSRVPNSYQYTAEIDGEGEVLDGYVYREPVQRLRNLLFWLWDEPW